MKIGQKGTMTLKRQTHLCKVVKNGNGDDKPTERTVVEAGTYTVEKIVNPVAEDCLPWIMIMDDSGNTVGMAEDPLEGLGIEVVAVNK